MARWCACQVAIDMQPCMRCSRPAPGLRGEPRLCIECAYPATENRSTDDG
jgi:hypothetical protein